MTINITIYFSFNDDLIPDKKIDYGPTISPICLPFEPADDPDHLMDSFVNIISFGLEKQQLRLENAKVDKHDTQKLRAFFKTTYICTR